jgi:hypothetical protein
MPLRPRRSRLWSWNEVRRRILAAYRAPGSGRERWAILVWQGDDPRVTLEGLAHPLLAFTMDVEPEADADNAVALAGFDSLETARAHCLEWTEAGDEADPDSLPESAQIGIYASIREPGFAERG